MKPRKKKAIMAGLLAASAALMSGCGTGPAPALYGPPPEMFEAQFDPEENIPEDVYGPPMFFENGRGEQSPAPTEGNP